MKRGFTQTLMMAAIVLMAAQAMAMAPTITEIPSPVVGNVETVTPANTFVYPDALDLSKYVTDDTTTNTSIRWYYEIMGSGQHIYKINGAPELDGTENLADPQSISTSKVIAGPGALSTDPYTTSTHTLNQTKITVRNIVMSPINGTESTATLTTNMPQDVTLYASDGETVTTKVLTFYTAAGHDDYLSPSGIKVVEHTFAGGTGSSDGATYTGNGVGHAIGSNGLCLTVGANGSNNGGMFVAPFGDLQLVKNAAYRIRLVVNGSQTAENSTPLWDVLVDNVWVDRSGQTPVQRGLMAYGADFWMYDGMGGENAYVQFLKGDVTYDFWWTPAPVLTDRWNDESATNPGPYATATGNNKDGMVTFRMLDYRVSNSDSVAGLHADKTVGSLCLKSMLIERYDIAQLTVDPTPVYQATSWSVTGAAGSPWNVIQTGNNQNVAQASDGITIKANSGSGTSASFYAALCPGDGVLRTGTSPDPTKFPDDYPCPVVAKTLYKITVKLSAPDDNSVANPVDAFWVSSNMLSSEEIQESYTTNYGWAHGMPSKGTAQDYVAFFYSNFGTNLSQHTADPAYGAFRPYFALTNNAALPNSGNKTGAIKVSGMKVEKVTGGFLK